MAVINQQIVADAWTATLLRARRSGSEGAVRLHYAVDGLWKFINGGR